jgi:hypothetical protein
MMRRTIPVYLRGLLALDESPQRIALAFAVGVFLAFSPFLGLHTLLGLGIAFLFGLNRVAMLVGLFVNNPWTLVPIYGVATYVGGLFVGFPGRVSLPEIGWNQLWNANFWIGLASQWRILIPTLLGSLILSVIFAALSYPLALYLLKNARECRSQRSSSPIL